MILELSRQNQFIIEVSSDLTKLFRCTQPGMDALLRKTLLEQSPHNYKYLQVDIREVGESEKLNV